MKYINLLHSFLNDLRDRHAHTVLSFYSSIIEQVEQLWEDLKDSGFFHLIAIVLVAGLALGLYACWFNSFLASIMGR